jgi:hypothetical protein
MQSGNRMMDACIPGCDISLRKLNKSAPIVQKHERRARDRGKLSGMRAISHETTRRMCQSQRTKLWI